MNVHSTVVDATPQYSPLWELTDWLKRNKKKNDTFMLKHVTAETHCDRTQIAMALKGLRHKGVIGIADDTGNETIYKLLHEEFSCPKEKFKAVWRTGYNGKQVRTLPKEPPSPRVPMQRIEEPAKPKTVGHGFDALSQLQPIHTRIPDGYVTIEEVAKQVGMTTEDCLACLREDCGVVRPDHGWSWTQNHAIEIVKTIHRHTDPVKPPKAVQPPPMPLDAPQPMLYVQSQPAANSVPVAAISSPPLPAVQEGTPAFEIANQLLELASRIETMVPDLTKVPTKALLAEIARRAERE